MAACHPDDSVDRNAAEEIERKTDVEDEGLVLEHSRQTGEEHEEVDRVPGQDSRQILDPATRRHVWQSISDDLWLWTLGFGLNPRGHGAV
jgi:hypothetical protein